MQGDYDDLCEGSGLTNVKVGEAISLWKEEALFRRLDFDVA